MRTRVIIAAWLLLAGLAPVGLSQAQANPSPPPAAQTQTEATRPNILVINTDDQRWDTMRVMPKTMGWFKDARTFDRATVTIPSCCPSRASLFSGRYPHNDGVRHQADAPNLDMSKTLPVLLHNAGYKTAMAGKYLNSWPLKKAPPGFDHYSANHGSYQPLTAFEDGQLRTVDAYSTTWWAGRLKDWIQGFGSNPWFAYYAPYAPHSPYTPEPKYAHADVGKCLQAGEADVSDKPKWVGWTKPSASRDDGVCHAQLRTLLSVDDAVNTLLSDLNARGVLKNTIVIYTSDNGYLWGEHNRSWKFVAYLPSIRVPLLVRWDGHLTKSTDHRMVAQLDFAPTLLKAAGVAVPSTMDGRDLFGAARTGPVLHEYWYDEKNSKVPDWAGLWDGNVHYIENLSDGKTVFRELYHTDTDPGELTNALHGKVSVADAALGAKLHDQLTKARTCKAAACP